MKTLFRMGCSLPGAVLATALLFLALALMIRQSAEVHFSKDKSTTINIAPQIEDTTKEQQNPAKFERPVLNQPPPPPPTVQDANFRPEVKGTVTKVPKFGNKDLDIGTGFNPDRDAQPLVRVPPQYPQRCQSRAQEEDYVALRFDVSPDGRVINPSVIESSSSCFERAAIRAVQRWKYQPKVVNGRAEARRGVRTQISFRLGN